MNVITETELLERIRAFLDRHDMAPTTFGRRATGEPQLISSIESGRSPSLKVVSRVVAFMDEQDAALAHARAAPAAVPEEDRELPFAKAPVNPTGASSATSSSTIAPPTSRAANGSCPSCCGADLAGPSTPTVAGVDDPGIAK